jgi:hypothetical protein
MTDSLAAAADRSGGTSEMEAPWKRSTPRCRPQRPRSQPRTRLFPGISGSGPGPPRLARSFHAGDHRFESGWGYSRTPWKWGASQLLGLSWFDVRLEDVDHDEIGFAWQVDRRGQRRPAKRDGSAWTVLIPRELALMLVRTSWRPISLNPTTSSSRRGRVPRCSSETLAARSGYLRLRRSTSTALRRSRSCTRPERMGDPCQLPIGALPSMHSFRPCESRAPGWRERRRGCLPRPSRCQSDPGRRST